MSSSFWSPCERFADTIARLVLQPQHLHHLSRPVAHAGRGSGDQVAPLAAMRGDGGHQVLRHRQRRKDARDLERAADAAPDDRGAASAGDVLARRTGSRPASGRNAPEIRLKNVVLPAPFGPITAVSEPAGKLERDVADRGDAAEGAW